MSETPLQTTQRYFKFVRSWTMTDPVHAKVELVTNSIDAIKRYQALLKLQNPESPAVVNNLVEIEEDLMERKMLIRDFAIGMRAEKMRSALLIIGNFTSEAGSRGTFSTGAKNVSQLGRVTWKSIRDGYYSSCYITTEGTGGIVDDDVPVTDEHRAELSIGSSSYMSQNGTVAILEYGAHVTMNPAEEQIVRFLNYFSMRDTLSSSDFNVVARYRNPTAAHPNAQYIYNKSANAPGISDIYSISTLPLFTNAGQWSEWFPLVYYYPLDSTLVERIAYVVPEYPQATAYFELYRTVKPAVVPKVYEEDTIQFGVSVVTSRAVHEQSCLWPEFRTNEDMRHFYGRLRCDYIDELLSAYDVSGPTVDNPVSIIDPSRLYGVNRSHKFIQWLFSIPTELVRKQLRMFRDEFDRKNGISSADVLNLAGTLQEVGEQLFEPQKIELNWRETADGKMLKAIHDQEKFVFLRDVGIFELHAASISGSAPDEEVPVFVFKNDSLVNEIEQTRSIATAEELAKMKKVRIVGKGDLVPVNEDQNFTPPEFKTLHPQIRIEILYSDAVDLTRRYRSFVDKELIRITININSPCFVGQLKKNHETGVISGFEKVSPVLVETLVQAFTHIYVKQKIQSASLRNVQFANNAAAAQEMKYSEEFDEALSFVEREIYGRVARAISKGALDDGVLTLDEVINA